MTAQLAIVGATGFIGRHCEQAAVLGGNQISRVAAPRLSAPPSDSPHDFLRTNSGRAVVAALAEHFRGANVVVNAAGASHATATGLTPGLYGANALLPLVVARAAQLAGASRFVHVSSAAVQGNRATLDETEALEAFSPYSRSKALGERHLLQMQSEIELIRFRPTSVHGSGRVVTRRLAALARSPWSSVAGSGQRPTPQVLVQNVGAAVIACAVHPGEVPRVVLQPSESLMCSTLLETLGCGQKPRRISEPLASAIIGTSRRIPKLAAQSRRLGMLWFGQPQKEDWLTSQGWSPPRSIADWHQLGGELRDAASESGGQ